MTRRNKIIYWIVTLGLSLGMVSSGMVQLLKIKEEVALFIHLGYPVYFMALPAVWKFLGVIAILVLGAPLPKEWACAGFFFAMPGALFSHIYSWAMLQAKYFRPCCWSSLPYPGPSGLQTENSFQ